MERLEVESKGPGPRRACGLGARVLLYFRLAVRVCARRSIKSMNGELEWVLLVRGICSDNVTFDTASRVCGQPTVLRLRERSHRALVNWARQLARITE